MMSLIILQKPRGGTFRMVGHIYSQNILSLNIYFIDVIPGILFVSKTGCHIWLTLIWLVFSNVLVMWHF